MNKTKIHDGILGLIVGDALGVPVEFLSRSVLDASPISNMIGYGSHNQPEGTWSDDTSLTLATMDGVSHFEDDKGIMQRFCKWLYKGRYTAHNDVFDVGHTTSAAIRTFKDTPNIEPIECGLTDKDSNGNGSLMRILPIAFSCLGKDDNFLIDKAMAASSWTHANIISKLCCAWYCLVAVYIYNGINFSVACKMARDKLVSIYGLSTELDRVYSDKIMSRDEIKSSGYVVHGLEVAKWAILTSSNYKEAVLKAINLGEDTDTNGAITGGLAGIYFGNIPTEWVSGLQNMPLIEDILKRYTNSIDIRIKLTTQGF